MTVCSMKEAWAVADKMFPTDYQISETSSQNAGYPVYRSPINFYDTICDLGDRLEVNIAGKSVNIWVEDPIERAMARMGFHRNEHGIFVMA